MFCWVLLILTLAFKYLPFMLTAYTLLLALHSFLQSADVIKQAGTGCTASSIHLLRSRPELRIYR